MFRLLLKAFCIVFTLLTMLSGCSTKQFVPKPGSHVDTTQSALITLKRLGSFYGIVRLVSVYDNGKKIGEVGSDGMLEWTRKEGLLKLDIEQKGFTDFSHSFVMEVKSGKVYNLTLDYTNGQVRLQGDELSKINVTSNPPGALIYAGPSQESLKSTGLRTPHTRSRPENIFKWQPEYYKVVLEGYQDSPVISKNNSFGNRNIHFDLSPIINKLSESNEKEETTPVSIGVKAKAKVKAKPLNSREGIFEKENRLALMIGNGSYLHGGNLDNPINDVRAIKKVLEALGFTVLKFENCTQKAMKRAMDQFGRKLKSQDVGLFFYSGHGVQVKGYNYLIPTDAKLDSENDAEYNCVRAGRVLAKMESAGSRTNIVILDACRDNPFERSWHRGTKGRGLAFMNAPSGSLIAYSTAPGKTALDGKGNNSPYTSALLRHIDTPNITVLQMFQRVRSTVIEGSRGEQIPWESTSLMGNFYFASKGEERDGLEEERRELERLRAEIERKRHEIGRHKVDTASLPQKPSYTHPSSSTSDVIKQDGVYVAYDNGIVKDTNTGLEWKAGPDKNTNWNEAKSWVQSLNLDGGGWRMPTTDELEGLYKKGAGNRNMTHLLKTTGWYVWLGETYGSSNARRFDLDKGLGDWYYRGTSDYGRAFAVRSRSDG